MTTTRVLSWIELVKAVDPVILEKIPDDYGRPRSILSPTQAKKNAKRNRTGSNKNSK